MAKVAVTKDKLDALAFSVSAKSGESLPLTIDEMCDAVDGIETGGEPVLQAKTNISPTTSSQTIQADSGYDGLSSVQINAMPSGSVSASAAKGSVSNHAISVTPTATVGTAGYLAAGSTNGTAVSVSASELVSGNLAISENGTGIDVTNYATVSVDVAGGGSTGLQIDSVDAEIGSASSSITFTGLQAEPTSFVIYPDSGKSTGSPANVVAVVFDGTTIHGQTASTTSNANAHYDTGFTKSYSNGTLTVTATSASFPSDYWMLDYTYGGSSSDIYTSDVQVGSGATSITFTGLEDEPIYWSCIFKSNFGTSSGYQRVMWLRKSSSNIYGACMDSSANLTSSYWTSSYSNGSLTITSNGTNQGGYFHQPGYYQLTYAIGGEVEPIEIQVQPLSVTQNGTYTAPSGTAYSPVTVNVSGGSANIGTKSVTNSSNTATSLEFTNMSGSPKAFFLRCTTQIQSSGSTSYYYVDNMRYNGTNTQGTYTRIGSTRGIYPDTTHYSYSYSGTTLTVTTSGSRTGAGGSFYNGDYELVYIY